MMELKTLLKAGRYITEINDNIYDITDFIDKHPGGDIIKGCANGNSGTAMFFSSHFNVPNIDDIPEIKKINMDKSEILSPSLNFRYDDGSFYNSLKLDIENHFRALGTDYSVPSLFSNICFVISICLFGLFYYLSYIEGNIFFSIPMGILSWNFAGTLVHDHGSHRTMCRKNNKIGNAIMTLLNSICFPGAFETHFIHSHYSHHTMVHHIELDSDENMIYPLVRLHQEQPKLWFHKFHVFSWPLAFSIYFFSYIGQTFRVRKYNWWRRHNHLFIPSNQY